MPGSCGISWRARCGSPARPLTSASCCTPPGGCSAASWTPCWASWARPPPHQCRSWPAGWCAPPLVQCCHELFKLINYSIIQIVVTKYWYSVILKKPNIFGIQYLTHFQNQNIFGIWSVFYCSFQHCLSLRGSLLGLWLTARLLIRLDTCWLANMPVLTLLAAIIIITMLSSSSSYYLATSPHRSCTSWFLLDRNLPTWSSCGRDILAGLKAVF